VSRLNKFKSKLLF